MPLFCNNGLCLVQFLKLWQKCFLKLGYTEITEILVLTKRVTGDSMEKCVASPLFLCIFHHHGRQLIHEKHSRQSWITRGMRHNFCVLCHRKLICVQCLEKKYITKEVKKTDFPNFRIFSTYLSNTCTYNELHRKTKYNINVFIRWHQKLKIHQNKMLFFLFSPL